jgi:hypothetical protein
VTRIVIRFQPDAFNCAKDKQLWIDIDPRDVALQPIDRPKHGKMCCTQPRLVQEIEQARWNIAESVAAEAYRLLSLNDKTDDYPTL